MKKGNNPYGFNLKKEIKDYKDLCKGKENRNYKTYLDWKSHIIDNIKGMDIRSLENFRHFCLHQKRTESRGNEIFLPLSIGFITLYLSKFVNPTQYLYADIVGFAIASIIVAVLVILNYFSFAFPNDFYQDVAEITQEYMNSFPEKDKMKLIAVKENEVQK